MAKVSPVSIKYMIYAAFRSEGPLEKPDVIGAIFGQTEGLLGEDMEMRELQKEGKIGRIEVELETVDGKTIGDIQVPSALDKSETTLIAAALETIDRIGPTEARIEVTKIEDVRGGKRDFIKERAKALMEKMGGGDSFKEMSEELKTDSRALKIQEYGESKIPVGDISGKEIIVVEGRADVINLLKNRVYNVAGMNGTKLPPEIAELSRDKEITLFIDGDRGGKLIAKNVIMNANVKYVAAAPDGKEVEELTGKEILVALRKRVDVRDFMRWEGIRIDVKEERAVEFEGDAKAKLRKIYDDKARDSKSALMLDNNLDVIRKVSAKEVVRSLKNSRQKVYAIVIDGTASGVIVKACDESEVKYLGATNFGAVEDASVELVSL